MSIHITALRYDDKKDSIHRNAMQLSVERDAEKTSQKENWYLCKQCHNRITNLESRVSINGKHCHAFANPSGIVFEIVCFSATRGYTLSGNPSYEFTWFAGYSWQIMICANCHAHLGWLFQNKTSAAFFGLISDKIVLDSSTK